MKAFTLALLATTALSIKLKLLDSTADFLDGGEGEEKEIDTVIDDTTEEGGADGGDGGADGGDGDATGGDGDAADGDAEPMPVPPPRDPKATAGGCHWTQERLDAFVDRLETNGADDAELKAWTQWMSDAATMSVGRDDALRIASGGNPTWLYLISCDIFLSETPDKTADAFIADADTDGDGEVTVEELLPYTLGLAAEYQALLDAEAAA